ncbi:MAG TPA: SPOR domain-containing protein [Acetobacteraceae bacterium]|nr:SPOR domain-containing protein [Acetobacteraceae bacterium]
MMEEPDLDIPAYASTRLRSRRVDSGTKRIALIAAGLAGLVIVLALVWSGVHTGFGPPPVIKPPPGPMRTVPSNPGGLQVPGANEQIMSGAESSAPPALAPPPPSPDFSKLQSEMSRQETARKPEPAIPPATVTEKLPLPPPPALPSAALPAAQPPAAALAEPALPAPAAPQGAPQTVPQTRPAGHLIDVQLAALNSQQAASQAWETLVARMPNLLANRTPIIQKAVVKGHVFWRLRVAGFTSDQAAKQFCATIRAEGAACEIADF